MEERESEQKSPSLMNEETRMPEQSSVGNNSHSLNQEDQ